jgi:hypothetical protein
LFDDPRNGRSGVVASVSTQESEVEVDADDAVGFFDGVELTVGQVARPLRQRVCALEWVATRGASVRAACHLQN